MDTNGGGKKVCSSKTSARSISFVSTSGKSAIVSACVCGRRYECAWQNPIPFLWLFQTMAFHYRLWVYIPYKFQIPTSSSAFLSRLQPFLCLYYESYFWVGYKGISYGRVKVTLLNREKFWRFWCAYCKPLGIDSYFEEVDFQTKTMVATGFSVHVRKSSHGHGKQVQVRILHSSLGGVNTKIALDTGRQPLHHMSLHLL